MEIKRNLKSLNNKTGEKIVSAINDIIDTQEKYKGCYFWTQTGNAASRRRQEFDTKLIFNLNGRTYDISQTLSISCNNFYFGTIVYRDGKKSNIRVLKNLI